VRTARAGAAAAALVLMTVLGACSDDGGTDGPGEAKGSAGSAERGAGAYKDCLAAHGVEMSGTTVEEDGVDPAALGRAYRECRDAAPDGVKVPVTAWELGLLRDFVSCMRDKGHDGYGDPDPQTGEFDLPADSEIDKDAEGQCMARAEQKAGQ
jgi:hypothetical protein